MVGHWRAIMELAKGEFLIRNGKLGLGFSGGDGPVP